MHEPTVDEILRPNIHHLATDRFRRIQRQVLIFYNFWDKINARVIRRGSEIRQHFLYGQTWFLIYVHIWFHVQSPLVDGVYNCDVDELAQY